MKTSIFLTIQIAAAIVVTTFAAQPENMAVMTGTNTQVIAGQKVFQSTGTQGAPLVGWSQSGAAAGMIVQDTHFDNPALLVRRDGVDGDTTTTPTLHVMAGKETQYNQPVFEVTGCLALSGDNHMIYYGGGGLAVPGGLLDHSTETVMGNLALDPIHRQGVAEDGETMRFTWAGGSLSAPVVAVTGTLAIGGSASVSGLLASHISDSTAAGRALLTAADEDTQRAVIGAQKVTTHAELPGTDISFASNGVYYKSISSATTFTFSTITNGATVIFELTTTGDYQPTWPVESTWPGGSVPAQPSTSTVVYQFTVINGMVRASATNY